MTAMEKAEESVDTEWMDVVATVQDQVVAEFRQDHADEDITIHKLRLAALRHPEIAYWVKYNRARQGYLRVGDTAPDTRVLCAVSGQETSLLSANTATAIPARVVVIAGSLS